MTRSLRTSSWLGRFRHHTSSLRRSIRAALHFEQLEDRRALAADFEAWQFGTEIADRAGPINIGANGSVYVSYSSGSSFVRKFNASGTAEWTISTPAAVQGIAVDETSSDPAMYIAANAGGVGTVLKYDLDDLDVHGLPTLSWSKGYETGGFLSYDRPVSGIAIDESGVYITGSVLKHTGPNSPGALRTDAYVHKVRSDTGEIEWTDEFGDPSGTQETWDGWLMPELTSGRSVTAFDGYVYLAATTSGSIAAPDRSSPINGNPNDAVVRKYNASTGEIIWTDQFGGTGAEGDDILEIAAGPSGVYTLLSTPGLNLDIDPLGEWWSAPVNTYLRKYELTDATGSFNHAWDSQVFV